MLTISIPDEIDQQLSAITDDKKEFILLKKPPPLAVVMF